MKLIAPLKTDLCDDCHSFYNKFMNEEGIYPHIYLCRIMNLETLKEINITIFLKLTNSRIL